MAKRTRRGFAGVALGLLLVACVTAGGATLAGSTTASTASATGPTHAVAAAPTRVAADGPDANDCCHSTLTQKVVDRTPLSGGGWQIVVEATLDSNAVCHVLLFQCVVEPELAPAGLTLQGIECVSPAWHQIQITLPFVGTVVDVCARFDHNSAGHDQRFRWTYTTPSTTGTFTETAKFFRFPEEFFFVRAQDTITIDVSPSADIVQDCPDLATIGTSITCTTTLEAHSTIPTASVVLTSTPAQLTPTSFAPVPPDANWNCATIVVCAYTAGPVPIGTYTFTSNQTVAGPAGDVAACAAILTGATTVVQDCDPVTVDADTDTFVNLSKVVTTPNPVPGGPIAWTVTVTNAGPTPAQAIRLFETPPALVDGAAIRFVGGDGAWVCTSSPTLLECTIPPSGAMPVGTATFEVTGTVSASAAPGAAIINEIEAEYTNNPYGPDDPVRDGISVEVAGIVVVRPTFAG